MPASTNFWMGFAGLLYFATGAWFLRKDVGAAQGWNKLLAMDSVFIAVSLAIFAPEHFHGPKFIQEMVPPWMPVRAFWTGFVGCALLAAATSLVARKRMGLSSALLGLMFFLFVCMIYLPNALRNPFNRFAWTFVLREGSFSAGALALAGRHGLASSPRRSKGMIIFGHTVLASAAAFFGIVQVLYPTFAPGVPLPKMTPSWIPFPGIWGCLTGVILLGSGIAMALNKRPRMAAATIGSVMLFLTLFLYLPTLMLALGGPPAGLNEALNYVADTLLFAGSAFAVASALPIDSGGAIRA